MNEQFEIVVILEGIVETTGERRLLLPFCIHSSLLPLFTSLILIHININPHKSYRKTSSRLCDISFSGFNLAY